jgi:hypothetical protein
MLALCLLLAPPPPVPNDLSGAWSLSYLGESAAGDAEPQRWGWVTLQRDAIRPDVYHLTRYSPEYVPEAHGLLRLDAGAWTGTLPVSPGQTSAVWHWDGRAFTFSGGGWLYYVRK